MAEVKRVTLSYREEPVGGEVSNQPKISDVSAIEQAQHLVLLIHGYNNDTQAAKEAYEGFHARQRDLDTDARYGIGRTFVEVYWPGDAAWGFASFLFYMGSIKHAIQTGERLAYFLAKHIGNAVHIDIVAHSMGCRLGLELLRTLESQPISPLIERIVFMAGGAPTFMLEQRDPPRRLRPSYNQVLRGRSLSLYSGSDMVLALAFPAGQSLAPGAEGFLPTALGHTKWTDATVPPNLDQQENPKAGHSDYWGWNTATKPLQCATKAAREVRSYLQFPSAGSRTIDERSLVKNSILEARLNMARREVIVRDIQAYA
ncbi:MAG: alpha/beta hydrolase [Gallionella sp.]|nr:alpha/beta hydrolase [Gallionella sp.]